jgi:hypothetical protein
MHENKSFEEMRMEKQNEILESGGDPFFLTDDLVYEKDPEEEDEEIPFNFGLAGLSGGVSSIIGNGNQGEDDDESDDNLWNGEEDESAYFD